MHSKNLISHIGHRLKHSLKDFTTEGTERHRGKKTNRIFTIRNKLIIIFLLVSILPFIILGYTIYKEGESILREKIFNQLSNIADGKEKKIRNWFIERYND